MAFGYQSISTTAWATATSVVVTKPANIAVSDLMIAYITGISLTNLTPPSGWTSADDRTNGALQMRSVIYYRIATSADVSATNYTWTFDSTSCHGSIIRVTEPSNLNTVLANGNGGQDNTATPTWTITITPDAVGNNLLFMFATASQNDNAIGGYAIVTSNPSWTEILDITGGGNSSSVAYAIRPQTTATGNASVTGGDTSADWVGQIISVKPGWFSTTAESVTCTDAKLGSIVATFADSTSLTDAITSSAQILWSNISKAVSSWTNQDKSS